MSRPLVKICGVTRVEDAVRAAELGATHIGLNFHPPSPRFVDEEQALRIAASVRGRVALVGVFVNRPAAEVEGLGQRLGLDLYQFHGDETVAELGSLRDRALKALRLDDSWSEAELDGFEDVWGFLVEAKHTSLYGGTGESWSYERIAGIDFGKTVLVAGGIRPETARRALARSGAAGIDVCSGVEGRPGVKDPELLERLFAELRIANSEQDV